MPVDFDRIRRDHPIADIVGQAIQLQRAGKEWKGCCPFHTEKTPSFHVIPAKEFAHCFGCGWHGDVIDFVRDFKNISTGEALAMLTDGDVSEQSEEERAARQRELKQREQKQQAERAKATAQAARIWEAAGHADPHHPYLARKQVEAHTCRQTDKGELLLPIYDLNGDILSIQTIDDNGGKKFYPGAPVGGGTMPIGINMGREILCEGYATGASIYDAIPDQVRVTFSCGNMEKVARELHAKGRAIVLASDTGMAAEKMARLASELNVPLVVPTVESDFNDMALALGTEAVAQAFRDALRAFAEERSLKAAIKEDSGPVDLWSGYDVPEFPLGIFPPVIERFALDNSVSIGADPAGLALSALAACSAVIRDSIRLTPRSWDSGWRESARIWVVLIGRPSTKKSPVINRATAPLKEIDREMAREANRKMLDWQENGREGPPPQCPRLILEDATTEAAQEKFQSSPNGLLLLQDELSGFFGRIEKYGGGSADRGFWLQAYNGGSYAIDRIGRGSKVIDNLSACLIGGIQPEAFRSIANKSDDDGLIQRVIPVMLNAGSKPVRRNSSDACEAYNSLIAALRDIKGPGGDFFGDVVTLEFTPEAEAYAAQFSDDNFDRVQAFEDLHSKFSSHLGKLDGLFSRLCVLFHCIENARAEKLPRHIELDTAQRVRLLIETFILRHSLAFYIGLLGMTENEALMKDIASSILAHEDREISNRDLIRRVQSYRKAEQYARDEAMRALVALGWLEPVGSSANKWSVALSVHSQFKQKAEAERVRRAEVVKIIKKTAEKGRSQKQVEI